MREIKNNVEVGKNQIKDVKISASDKTENKPEVVSASAAEIKDFSNPAAEALGRAHASGTDNIKHDVAFGMDHPDAIKSADKFFEMTYNTLLAQGHPNAYEEAASQASAFGREFV